MTAVLMVVSAADHWTLKDGTKHPTGFWAEELVVPYDVFADAGFEITVATPDGVAPTMDPGSLKLTSGVFPKTAKYLKKRLTELGAILSAPENLSEMDPDDYDVVFYPGGHGPMEDLVHDQESARILRAFADTSKPVGVLCHSSAALLATVDESGSTPFEGRHMTAFSNREERLQAFGWKAKWYLETRLTEIGMQYSKGLPLRPYVIVDGNLFSGQNPQSSRKLAEEIVAAAERPSLGSIKSN